MNKVNDIIFKSRFSKWIAGMYWLVLAFLIMLLIGMLLALSMTFVLKSLLILTFGCVFVMFIYFIWKGYTMKFIISKKQIIIYGLLRKIFIDISDVENIKKIPIPFGFRLFGASCLGGLFFFPGIGNTSVTMSNFDDGVLITTKQKENYLITPENPQDFIKIVLKTKNN